MSVVSNARANATELVVTTMLPRASRLTRLLLRSGSRELSRTEAGLLTTLLGGPRGVSELAETEALAQPTATQVIDRLRCRGLVVKARSPQDGRVVLVSLSGEGRELLVATQTQYRAVLRGAMEELSDEELTELAAATETLGRLIEKVQQP